MLKPFVTVAGSCFVDDVRPRYILRLLFFSGNTFSNGRQRNF